MATDLASLRDRVEAILEDATNTKWSTTEVDEAIRQALHRYSLRLPRRVIASLTLSAAGREVDISSLTYRTIERVWWDYDSSDPAHPPEWRDFEVWPGDLLFINDDDEPAASDVVRVWYTTDHTLDDLDSATATTYPARHDTLIATGAAGFAAQSRALTLSESANLNAWAPRNLREWADRQIAIFERGLADAAAREAALDAGIAKTPALDRWDDDNDW
jgi:hypothetical protein